MRKILPDGLLTDPLLAGIARVYHSKGKVVTTPSGAKAVICSAGEIDPTHYIDSKTGSVILYNHLTLASAEDSSNAPVDESLELKRSAIQSVLDSYVKQKYPSEDSAAGVFSKDGNINIIIVGEKKNLRNFWSGRWSSNWTVTVSASSGSITGDVKVTT